MSARGVGRDDDLDALELLEVGVAGRSHRAAQRTDEVERAVGRAAGAGAGLLERPRRAHARAPAGRELGVVRPGSPGPALTGSLARAREGRAKQHGVRAARDRLDEVAGAAHAAV